MLDLRLQGISGYDVLPKISKSTNAKILVLTALESDHNIQKAWEEGAHGYCFKDVKSQELINAIMSVLSGVRYVSKPSLRHMDERREEIRSACDFSIIWGYFNRDSETPARILNCSKIGCFFQTGRPVTVIDFCISVATPYRGFAKPSAPGGWRWTDEL